jgi:hypothetical protein
MTCLSLEDKQTIETQFIQNEECHRDLKTASILNERDSYDWEYFIGSLAIGLLGGFVIGMQVHK